MTKCVFCDRKAKYRSTRVVEKRKEENYVSYYCEQHKREGIEFGFLEDTEFVEVEKCLK